MTKTRRLVVLSVLASLSVATAPFVMAAAADEPSDEQTDACRTARTVGEAVMKLNFALAGGDLELLEEVFDTEFQRGVGISGPSSVIPRVRGVGPTQMKRGGPWTWRYRSFGAANPKRFLEIMARVGRIPFRFKQISLTPPTEDREFQGFAFTGRGTGPAWRRALQVYGKAAISCDGTVPLLRLKFRGGNTGIPLTSGWCRGRRNLAVVSGARICTQSSHGYRSWKRREG